MSLIKKALNSRALKKMICHLIKIRMLYCKFKSNQCTFKNNQCIKAISDPYIKHFQKKIYNFRIKKHKILHLTKTKQTVQTHSIKIWNIYKKYKVNASKSTKKVYYLMNKVQIYIKRDKYSKKSITHQPLKLIPREISRLWMQMKFFIIL